MRNLSYKTAMFGLVIHHHLVKELSLPETVPGGMAAYRQTLAVLGSPGNISSRNHPFSAVYKGEIVVPL